MDEGDDDGVRAGKCWWSQRVQRRMAPPWRGSVGAPQLGQKPCVACQSSRERAWARMPASAGAGLGRPRGRPRTQWRGRGRGPGWGRRGRRRRGRGGGRPSRRPRRTTVAPSGAASRSAGPPHPRVGAEWRATGTRRRQRGRTRAPGWSIFGRTQASSLRSLAARSRGLPAKTLWDVRRSLKGSGTGSSRRWAAAGQGGAVRGSVPGGAAGLRLEGARVGRGGSGQRWGGGLRGWGLGLGEKVGVVEGGEGAEAERLDEAAGEAAEPAQVGAGVESAALKAMAWETCAGGARRGVEGGAGCARRGVEGTLPPSSQSMAPWTRARPTPLPRYSGASCSSPRASRVRPTCQQPSRAVRAGRET